MLWVVGAGQNSVYIEKITENRKIYIHWDGYRFSLKSYQTRELFSRNVEKEKNTVNRTSVSNWAGQLYSFVEEMNAGDLVLIPTYKSRRYILAKIPSEYFYDKTDVHPYFRGIKVVCENIPADFIMQSVRYSLGTFRTIFKLRQEDEILHTTEA